MIESIEKNFDIGIFDITVEGAFLSTVASILLDTPSILMEVNDQSVGEYERLANSVAAYFVDFA